MNAPSLSSTVNFNIGLLVVRLVFGLLMAGHGAQKLLGWFGGYGIKGTGEFFVGLGFARGRFFATAASVAEITGGALIALGLLGPVGPALVLATMIVAAVTVHLRNGVFATTNGVELPLMFGAVSVGFALIGFGSYAVDALVGLDALWTPTLAWIVLLVGTVGAFGNLAVRRKTPVSRVA